MMPTVGRVAPQLSLKDAAGRAVRLSDFRGKRIVLYFYPRDMTQGCTREACGFRDDLAEFERRGPTTSSKKNMTFTALPLDGSLVTIPHLLIAGNLTR